MNNNNFEVLYIPAAVPTFHMESAKAQLDASIAALREIEPGVCCPDSMLLSPDAVGEFMAGHAPELVIFQNLTFANSAYITQVIRRCDCPILLWTLREPVIDGGRLRLNSLTGAYSAANTLCDMGRRFEYVFGSPEEESVRNSLRSCIAAARVKAALRGLKIAAVGHTPQGFGFGRALDNELMRTFGVELETVEAGELMDRARALNVADCAEYLQRSRCAMCGLDNTPEDRLNDYARLYRAYSDYAAERGIGALASRCWPDYFTRYGTPVCAVLSMLNDDGIAAACEADIYGALSMWIGMQLSGKPVFFGDPVSLNEEENTISYWHCGAAACSLARSDTGAAVGVHPNRKIGPAMDFGCAPKNKATVFRVSRKPDGSFRFFITEGSIKDKPKQFTGTSLVFHCNTPCREIVESTIKQGLEPHFAIIDSHQAQTLTALGNMLGVEVVGC